MNGLNWHELYETTIPYVYKNHLDITAEMKKQGWTVEKMFKTADQFFVGLGLAPLPASFWKESMFKQPKGREVVCDPGTYDFQNNDDYRYIISCALHFPVKTSPIDCRIRMCAEVGVNDFVALH